MDRNREFVKNTVILFIGKFATQFMSLLLLPLFTHYLLSEDYGIVDLFQTYISLFIPILTLRIDSAIFRFLIDKRNDENGKKKVVSNILLILLMGLVPTFILGLIIFNFLNIKYIGYVIVNLLILMLSSVVLQILRGLGKNKEYSIASIITGATTLIGNVILILCFNIGAESILISSSIANFICVLYVCIKVKIVNLIDLKSIDKKEIKNILKYSLPMIPNSLSWWVVNVSDRTIISTFLGVAYNGIYTVSCKFSNILNSVYSIFNMSWQETAILHIKDMDKDEFFSKMINKIFMFFSSISILIIAFLPFVYDIIIGDNYISSYSYIPILLYANSWNVLIGLIGGIYVAVKRTKKIANTTIMSAALNIIINIILIKFIGLYAAAISTLISYLIIGIYRYIDCKKYVNLKLDFKVIILFTIIFIISSILYIININYLCILNLFFVSIYVIILNRDMINIILRKIKKLIK